MSKKFELNQHDIRGDGRVVIYQRAREDGTIGDKWQMRISTPNSTGYFRASTKQKDKADATRIALNKYEELYMKVLGGSVLNSIGFKEAYEGWKKEFSSTQSRNRNKKYIDKDIAVLGNYPFNFFVKYRGNLHIDKLDNSEVQNYFVWRRENSFRNGIKFIPADDTLRKELLLISGLMKFCKQKGYINELTELSPPEVKDNRRPAFSPEQYKILYTYARKWVREAKHASVKRDRFYLQHLVLILVNSGIRIGEARTLKWGNLRTIRTEDGNRMVLSVSGKTGNREVVMQKNGQRYFERIYDFRQDELNAAPAPDELVFCHQDGREIGSFRKSFASLLQGAGVVYDGKGDKHTLYSLRHTYATFRLSEEVSPFLLAKNMGTSVQMLQRFYGQVVSESVAKEITKSKPKKRTATNAGVRTHYPFN